MTRAEILSLINKDESALILEIFRRQKVQKTIESEVSIINQTVASIESTPITSADVRKNKLISKSSTDSTKKKHLTFSKDEV